MTSDDPVTVGEYFDSLPRWFRDTVLIVGLLWIGLALDFAIGWQNYLHTGPFGMVHFWSPGLTLAYLYLCVRLLAFVRADPLMVRSP